MKTPTCKSNLGLGRLAKAAIALIIGAAAYFLVWHFNFNYHLATVQRGVLYRDGARSAHEFDSALAKVKPKTVVCLVDDGEMNDPGKPQFKTEISLLEHRGIRMERIPVKLGGWPTTQDVQRFLTVAADPKNQPVLVHCAQGVRRTGMMVAAFQESVLGYDSTRAKAEIVSFGHSETTINDIRRFIDAYDPKSQTVSPDLK